MVVNYYAAVPLALSLGALFYMLCKASSGSVMPESISLSSDDSHDFSDQLSTMDNTLGTMGLDGGERMDTFIDMTFEPDVDLATYHL